MITRAFHSPVGTLLKISGLLFIFSGFTVFAEEINYRFDEQPNSSQNLFEASGGPDGYLGISAAADSDDANRVAASDYADWNEGYKLDFEGGKVATVPAGFFKEDLSQFSIEFWAGNPDLQWSGGYLYLLEKAYGSGTRSSSDEMSFQAYSNGGGMGLGFRWIDTNGSQHVLNADGYFWNGNWKHCTVTYDADGGTNNYKLYINGSLESQATVTAGEKMRMDDNPFCLGGLLDYDGSVYTANSNFHMDDFRMYDYVIDVNSVGGYNNEYSPYGLVHETYSSLVVNVKGRRFGAVGDGSTDDTDAIQNAINYSVSLGHKKVLVPAGTYKISSTIYLNGSDGTAGKSGTKAVSFLGQGAMKTIFDVSDLSAQSSAFVAEGGSGTLQQVVFGDFAIDGGEEEYGFEFENACGQYLKRVKFRNLKVGVLYHNNGSGAFTEYCIVEDSEFREIDTCVLYSLSGGHESFHGSGIRNCLITLSEGDKVIEIENGGLVYNAPLSCQIWHDGNATVIDNNNTSPRRSFYGHGVLTVEESDDGTLTCCTGSVPAYLTGSVVGIGNSVKLGKLRTVKSYQLCSDGSVEFMSEPYAFEKDLSTGSTTLEGSNLGHQGGTLISIRIYGTNYDYRYLIITSRDGYGNAGTYSVLATLKSIDSSGYGAPVFSVNSDGELVVTNNSYPASGITAALTASQTGFRADYHPSN